MPRSAALKPITSTCSPDGTSRDGARPVDHPGIRVALVLLRGYKLLVSPFFAGGCRFHPSCSDYMADAIRLYGLGRGIVLGLKRLSRCRPFGGHGFDPVPRP
jgi:uncharacterized protein